MKKTLLLLIGALTYFISSAQEIILDPIENIPVPASYFSISQGGNWGYNYLKIDQYKDAINMGVVSPVVVVVFDADPDLPNKEFDEVRWPQYDKNFARNAKGGYNGHGIHVAGIIGAVSDSGLKLGVADLLAKKGLLKIVMARVLDESGRGFIQDVDDAINYYNINHLPEWLSQGYKVIYNFSLGSQSIQESTNQRLIEAEAIGALCFAAAGNNGAEYIGSPANGPSAHAVLAMTASEELASFSNYGPESYILMPGVGIYSTYKDNRKVELSGTSMASPMAAGTAAVLWSINPDASNRQISRMIADKAKDLMEEGWDKKSGFGSMPLSYTFATDAVKYPDEGNGNPIPGDQPDEPSGPKEKGKERTVRFPYSGEITILWRSNGDTGPLKKTKTKFDIEVKTKYFDADSYDLATTFVEEWSKNRGFVLLAKSDNIDAGHWFRYFLERFGDTDQPFEVELKNMWVLDTEGRQFYVPEDYKGSKFNQRLILLFNKALSTFTIN